MNAVLTCTGVTRHFGGVSAVDAVDLTVEGGEILGLIGPNGAGKTTLVNVITGFDSPDSGSVQLRGRDITTWAPARRVRAGLSRTFQGARVFPRLTVEENIRVAVLGSGTGPRAQRHSKVGALLELGGLVAERHLRGSDLPAGLQRRVSVVRAIASNPVALLLDEPAAGLNDVESKELVELLLRVRDAKSLAIVLIEHDMSVVMALSDQLQVLHHGRTIAVGTPAHVSSDPEVVSAYLGAGGGSDA